MIPVVVFSSFTTRIILRSIPSILLFFFSSLSRRCVPFYSENVLSRLWSRQSIRPLNAIDVLDTVLTPSQIATEGCMHFLYWALCLSWAFSVKTGKFRDRCQHLYFCIVHKRDSNSDLGGSVRRRILIWSFSQLVSAKLTATMPVKYPWHWAEIKHSCFPPARLPLQHCRLALSLYQNQAKVCARWFWWGKKWRHLSWEQLEVSSCKNGW